MLATANEHKVNAAKGHRANRGSHNAHGAKATAHSFGDDVRGATAAVKDDVEAVARRTGHHVRELADTAGHNIKDVREATTERIRDNPIQSSVIALGIGLLVGMLYRR
jgi:ElaB/YqjD/DUF883 family membrane-anchored ribosome-binding protein